MRPGKSNKVKLRYVDDRRTEALCTAILHEDRVTIICDKIYYDPLKRFRPVHPIETMREMLQEVESSCTVENVVTFYPNEDFTVEEIVGILTYQGG